MLKSNLKSTQIAFLNERIKDPEATVKIKIVIEASKRIHCESLKRYLSTEVDGFQLAIRRFVFFNQRFSMELIGDDLRLKDIDEMVLLAFVGWLFEICGKHYCELKTITFLA